MTVLGSALLFTSTVSADLVDVVAERSDFGLDGLTMLSTFPGYGGERVYNVYAVFDNPNDQCVGVLGTPGQPFQVQTQAGVGFVNAAVPNDFPPSMAFVAGVPELNWDSFMTIGRTFSDTGVPEQATPLLQGPNTDPWPPVGDGNMGWVVAPSASPVGGFNEIDLEEVFLGWGTPGPAGDLNLDNNVDVLDLELCLLGWGQGGLAEPQTVAGADLRVLIMRVVVPPAMPGPGDGIDFNIVVVGGADGMFQSLPFSFSTEPPTHPACGPGAGPCNMGNGSPGCEDVDCCNQVCLVLPHCCDVDWDPGCAGEAINQGCAVLPGCMDGSEVPESEPCGMEENGGCNDTPTQYIIATCGESYSGTASSDGIMSDEDWYLVDLPGGGDLNVELKSEFEGTVCIVAGVGEPGVECPGPVVQGVQGMSLGCLPGVASATDLPPGLYCIVVAPAGPTPPCGDKGTGYVMTPLPIPPVASPGGEECVPENRGACCLPSGNCNVMLPDDCTAMGGEFMGLLSNCSIPPCQACCLPDGSCLYTADASDCDNAGGTLQGVTVAGGGSSVKACCFDDGRCCRRLTQVDCEAAGGEFQDFNNCANCPKIDNCPTDLNGDGVTNVLDLVLLISTWAEYENGVTVLVAIIGEWGMPCPAESCGG